MIEFKKEVKKILPYDSRQYIEFLYDDFDPLTKWYGVSFQLNKEEKEINLTEFVEQYECWFKDIISRLDNGSFWIVNHDKKDLNWFPNGESYEPYSNKTMSKMHLKVL